MITEKSIRAQVRSLSLGVILLDASSSESIRGSAAVGALHPPCGVIGAQMGWGGNPSAGRRRTAGSLPSGARGYYQRLGVCRADDHQRAERGARSFSNEHSGAPATNVVFCLLINDAFQISGSGVKVPFAVSS